MATARGSFEWPSAAAARAAAAAGGTETRRSSSPLQAPAAHQALIQPHFVRQLLRLGRYLLPKLLQAAKGLVPHCRGPRSAKALLLRAAPAHNKPAANNPAAAHAALPESAASKRTAQCDRRARCRV